MNDTLAKLVKDLTKAGCYDELDCASEDCLIATTGNIYHVYFVLDDHEEHEVIPEATRRYEQLRELSQMDLRGFVYDGMGVTGLKYTELTGAEK